jgi:hypothetical protein
MSLLDRTLKLMLSCQLIVNNYISDSLTINCYWLYIACSIMRLDGNNFRRSQIVTVLSDLPISG